ncbi:MAG: hypothetical protein ACO4AU_05180 [bacterium]|jgi:hypothetical protein
MSKIWDWFGASSSADLTMKNYFRTEYRDPADAEAAFYAWKKRPHRRTHS